MKIEFHMYTQLNIIIFSNVHADQSYLYRIFHNVLSISPALPILIARKWSMFFFYFAVMFNPNGMCVCVSM